MVIRESSESERSQEEEELSDWGRDNMGYAKQLAFSHEKVDQRLFNLYMFRRAQ